MGLALGASLLHKSSTHGIVEPPRGRIWRDLDRKRKKRMSNEEWKSPADEDAMKDGRTHLACEYFEISAHESKLLPCGVAINLRSLRENSNTHAPEGHSIRLGSHADG